jgi:hypothetical protein
LQTYWPYRQSLPLGQGPRVATMQEPALSFEGVILSPQKKMVRMVYKDMWDHADKSLIPKIFPPSCHAGANLARFALCHTVWKESLQLVPENIGKPFKARFRRVKLIVPGTGLRF